jgi:hypothetical protein
VKPVDETPILVLTEPALQVRRSLEPTAWLVLEELVLRSDALRPLAPVRVDVRSLATALGRSKDAVARALQILIESGLVERHSSRDELTGRFGAASYRIDLHSSGLRRPQPSDIAGPTSVASRAARPTAHAAPLTPRNRLFEP